MPYIYGLGFEIYFDAVLTERISRSSTVTSSPIEGNIQINDHVSSNPIVLNLTGVCTVDAANKLNNLNTLWQQRALCGYVGRNTINNAIITSFTTDHGVEFKSAFQFTMVLTAAKISHTQEFQYNTSLPPPEQTAQIYPVSNVGITQPVDAVVDQATQAELERKAQELVSAYFGVAGRIIGG